MTTEKWTPTYYPPQPVPPDSLEIAFQQYHKEMHLTNYKYNSDLTSGMDKAEAERKRITEGMIEWLKEVWLPHQLAESNRVYAIMFKYPGEWRCRTVVNEDATRPRIYTTLAAASKEKQRMEKLHSDVTYYVVEVKVQQ